MNEKEGYIICDQSKTHFITAGRYSSVSEVIRSALRLLEQEEKKERELIKVLEIGEQSGFVEDFDPKQNLNQLHRQNL
jgi:antitoxin ParD1/3/4